MSARLVFVIINILNLLWRWFKLHISKVHRLKPIPEEIKDIYSEERRRMFLDYEAETDKLFFRRRIILCVLDSAFIMSPIFSWIETIASRNVYLIVAYTFVAARILDEVVSMPFDYICTFSIEEKYKLNKMTKRTFFRDEWLDVMTELIVGIGIAELITYLLHDMESIADKNHMSLIRSFKVALQREIGIIMVIFVIAMIAIISMRMKYKFVPLKEGELRDKINDLQKDSRRKVKRISVYNESSKSVEKNAFLLRILFYREFGIADNFINENSERELLAVLSHEVGHLKHKKTLFNYLGYFALLALFLINWFCLANQDISAQNDSFDKWIYRSFNITVPNYYIVIALSLAFAKPVLALFNMYKNYNIRKEEYEADLEAVKNGYGEDLIKTFKDMSNDELIDINPHPLIAILYHDHPTIYQRIVAIRNAEKEIRE